MTVQWNPRGLTTIFFNMRVWLERTTVCSLILILNIHIAVLKMHMFRWNVVL